MATHKAEYHKLNGNTWDKYHFKTTADMVEGLDTELSQVFGSKNVGGPNLQDKEYLDNGVYRFYDNKGITIDYNVYSGIWTFNGQSTDNLDIRYSNTNLVGEVITATNYIIERNNSNIITSMITIGSGSSRMLYYRNNINTITAEVDYNYNTFYIHTNDVFDNFQFKLQLEKGSQATPYTIPIQPIIYHETKYLEETKVDITTFDTELSQVHGGKNFGRPDLEGKEHLDGGVYRLYNADGITLDYNVYNGIISINGTPTKTFEYNLTSSTNTIHLPCIYSYYYVGGTATFTEFSIFTLPYNSNNVMKLTPSNYMNNNFKVLTYQFNNIRFQFLNGETFNNLRFKLQLEKGDTATPYTLPAPFVLPHEAVDADWVASNTRSSAWTPAWFQVSGKPDWIGDSKPTYDLSQIADTDTYKRVTADEKATWNSPPAWGKLTGKPDWIGDLKPKYNLGEIAETDTYKRVTQAEKDAWSNTESTITGAATTITSNDLPTGKVLISNSSGKVAASTITAGELGVLSGVTSGIQHQLDVLQGLLSTKANLAGANFTEQIKVNYNGALAYNNVGLEIREREQLGYNQSSEAYAPAIGFHWANRVGNLLLMDSSGILRYGSAGSSQAIVLDNDSRLTDARPASDVSSWAKASSKPSYTAAEVGARPDNWVPTADEISDMGSIGKKVFQAGTFDFDSFDIPSGIYAFSNIHPNNPPTGQYGTIIQTQYRVGQGHRYGIQIAFHDDSDRMFTRRTGSNGNSPWIEIASQTWVTANTRSADWTPTWDQVVDRPTFKTINGQQITGTGDISISGGGGGGSSVVIDKFTGPFNLNSSWVGLANLLSNEPIIGFSSIGNQYEKNSDVGYSNMYYTSYHLNVHIYAEDGGLELATPDGDSIYFSSDQTVIIQVKANSSSIQECRITAITQSGVIEYDRTTYDAYFFEGIKIRRAYGSAPSIPFRLLYGNYMGVTL